MESTTIGSFNSVGAASFRALRAHKVRCGDEIHAVFPESSDTEPHPLAIEMAGSMQDIASHSGGVVFADLIGAGYSSAEIIEHHAQAAKLAAEQAYRRSQPKFDRIADMAIKAKTPIANRLPLPEGVEETPQLVRVWGSYCAGRAALLLDPCLAQRERCIVLLMHYLGLLPLLPGERNRIVNAVSASISKRLPSLAQVAAE